MVEREQNDSGVMRKILFKTKEMAVNMLEMSLEGSNDYSNFNTCDDYLTSARTNRNKYAPMRQTLNSQGASTQVGDDLNTMHPS